MLKVTLGIGSIKAEPKSDMFHYVVLNVGKQEKRERFILAPSTRGRQRVFDRGNAKIVT